MLEKEPDFKVIGEAENGSDVIRLVSNLDADVLILDITMPGLSASETVRALKERVPQLRIVILTMHSDEYYLKELFQLGINGYVLKKSTATEVFQAIRAVNKGEFYVDPLLTGHVLTNFLGKTESPIKKETNVLTARELEVCRYLAYGHTNTEIAKILNISDRTVETHRTNILTKLELKSRADLVRFAITNGLMTL